MSITFIIIIITVIISIAGFIDRNFLAKSQLNPFLVFQNKQYYRLFTHALVHADYLHLFVNMYVLYSFGKYSELFFQEFLSPVKGVFYFITLYIGGILFSSLPSIKKHKNNIHYNAVGASGAVSAILFSSIIFSPLSSLRIMFIPIDIPAIVFGVIYLIYEAYMDKKASDHIAHDAHFWGAAFGILFTLLAKKEILLHFLQQLGIEL